MVIFGGKIQIRSKVTDSKFTEIFRSPPCTYMLTCKLILIDHDLKDYNIRYKKERNSVEFSPFY